MSRVYKDSRLRRLAGQVVWCIDYVDANGQRRREKTSATTRDMAHRILRMRLHDVETAKIHGLPVMEKIAFDAFIPQYLAHVRAVRSETSQSRVKSFVKMLSRVFGNNILSRVTTGDVQRWVDSRSQERTHRGKTAVKPATVEAEFVCLSAIFREAAKRGYVFRNPCRGVTRPRVNNKITRCLTEEQEKDLLAACSEFFRPLVCTALYTGLRKRELQRLSWGDVDFGTGMLTVIHGKGEKMRHVPMVPELQKVLSEVPRSLSNDGAASPYVFNNPETGTAWVDITKQWHRALRGAGIRDFRFHDLRHTFASRLVQRGVPLKAVQELLGHADIKMTLRYAHLASSDLKDAVAVLSSSGTSNWSYRPRPASAGSRQVGAALAQAKKGA